MQAWWWVGFFAVHEYKNTTHSWKSSQSYAIPAIEPIHSGAWSQIEGAKPYHSNQHYKKNSTQINLARKANIEFDLILQGECIASKSKGYGNISEKTTDFIVTQSHESKVKRFREKNMKELSNPSDNFMHTEFISKEEFYKMNLIPDVQQIDVDDLDQRTWL